MSRSLAADFNTEKNLLWARPFCTAVFHFGGAIGDIYIGEFDVTLSGNAHKGVVDEWGQYSALVKPMDGIFQVNTAACKLNNFPSFAGPKRFSDLCTGLSVLGIEVDVYLNFLKIGTSATWLQNLAFSAVMRPKQWSPENYETELHSISEKYLDAEIGYVINNTDFPNADLDDIGKRANEIVGSVKKVHAHAVIAAPSSVLRAAMTVASTTVPITDDFYNLLPAAGTIQTGNETIPYTSKSGAPGSYVLGGLTRASPEAHSKDDTIFQILSEYVYQAAGHQMQSIDVVYVRRGTKTIPLAASAYTVELANSTRVPGKTMAFIKFTAPPLISAKDLVALVDSGVVDTIAANKAGTVTENIAANKAGTVTENLGVSQSNTESKWTQQSSDEVLSFASGLAPGSTQDVAIAFDAQEKTKSSGNFEKKFSWTYSGTAVNTEFYLVRAGGAGTTLLYSLGDVKLASPLTVEGQFWGHAIRRKNVGGSVNLGAVTVSVSGKQCVYNIDATVSKTGTVTDGISVSKSGTVTDGISVSKSGTITHTVSLSATSTADKVIGDEVLFDGKGYQDDGSGTYTGMAGALVEKAADVIHLLARLIGGIPLARIDVAAFQQARADAPASYKFAGVLTDRSSKLRELLLALGMQSRHQVDWPVDKLTCRFLKSSYAAVSAKAVTRDMIKRATLSCRLGTIEDVVNAIQVFYGRDWTMSRGQTAYTQVTPEVTDATSIAAYGTRRQADRYWYDFVASDNATMANDLRDFELTRRKNPPRYVDIVGFLDNFELLPGDLVAPDYLVGTTEKFDGLDGTVKFLVESAGFAPGILSRKQGPKMQFVLRQVS